MHFTTQSYFRALGFWLGMFLLPAAHAVNPLTWDANAQGQFITSLCRDTRGNLWIGTEDNGCYRFTPSAPKDQQYTHFTSKDGLGDDDAYALTCDKAGRIWAGTLNHGVSVFNGKEWKTYGPLNGPLGSRVFALAVSPKDGGVWGATEAGLFRYGNDRWTYYTRADGLPSDQASSLAFAPDGTLYVGTQCDGLAVGSPTNDYHTWRLVPGPERAANQSRGSGLPISQINALLVARSGAVYCGTTAGLARSEDGGKTWRFRRGADWLDKGSGRYDAGLAQEAKISGIEVLPTGLPASTEKSLAVNAAGGAQGRFAAMHGFVGGSVFTSQNTVDTKGVAAPAPPALYQSERWGNCAFTASGLKPLGSYRVRLHLAELSQTAPGQRLFNVFAGGQPVLTRLDIFAAAGGANKALVKEFSAHADRAGHLVLQFQGSAPSGVDTGGGEELSEDYVTSLSEDGAGHLLVGHRQKGLEVWDETREARLYPGAKDAASSDYVFALLPLQAGGVLVGKYGGGLAHQDVPGLVPPKALAVAALHADAPPLPLPAAPPTAAELRAMLARVQSLKGEMPVGGGGYLGEDWQTQGDWVGRYGRKLAILCAARAPFNHDIQMEAPYYAQGKIGPHHDPNDGIRNYCTWIKTDNPKSLYDPIPGYRRQAEWDDHGEVYGQSFSGPDIWIAVTVPEGVQKVSLYFFNKDAHLDPNVWGGNRYRDYEVALKPYQPNLEDADKLPSIARTRVHDFWGGVYKSFLVQGPSKYWLKIAKDGSLNTIVSSVLIDKLRGPINKRDKWALGWMGGVHYDPPDPNAPMMPDPHLLDKLLAAKASGVTMPVKTASQTRVAKLEASNMATAALLWPVLDEAYDEQDGMILQKTYRTLAYRSATAMDAPETLQANWRWALQVWLPYDREEFEQVMTQAHQALLVNNPKMKGLEF